MVLIGRQHELAVLADALQRASGGETARLLLEGPLGSGTSSLLDELQSRLSGMPEVIVCRGRAYVPRSGLAYSALSDALRGVLSGLPDEKLRRVLGAETADMARLMPDLADRFETLGAAPNEAPRAPDQVGARVQESLLAIIERLATDGAVGRAGSIWGMAVRAEERARSSRIGGMRRVRHGTPFSARTDRAERRRR